MGLLRLPAKARFTHAALVAVHVVALLWLASAGARAQGLRGSVVDSATHKPIAGAVLLFMDSSRLELGRAMTNERGEYRVRTALLAARVRVLRLGFRARELSLPQEPERRAAFDIALALVPALLGEVTVSAAPHCPRRTDAAAAFALLEQARAGLLAAIVTNEQNPAVIKVLAYDRTMVGNSREIESQTVRIDSSAGATKSFFAVHSAAEFLRLGFVREVRGALTYLGPDAETLLDDTFASGYCFRIHDAIRERPGQVGLSFQPEQRKRGRVDIDGTLWVDTVSRVLSDIEFEYVGTTKHFAVSPPGGTVHFRAMPNGGTLIDRWTLLLTGAEVDTNAASPMARAQLAEDFAIHEGGAEIAGAEWPDSLGWRASLGRLALHIDDKSGHPETHQGVRLAGTGYVAMPDSNGNVLIEDLLPGPYEVLIVDAATHTTIPAKFRFVAQRDSVVHARIVAPAVEHVRQKDCLADSRQRWVTAWVVRENGSAVAGAAWDLGTDLNAPSEVLMGSGRTAADGSFGFCSSALIMRRAGVRVVEDGNIRRVAIRTFDGIVSQMTIVIPQE